MMSQEGDPVIFHSVLGLSGSDTSVLIERTFTAIHHKNHIHPCEVSAQTLVDILCACENNSVLHSDANLVCFNKIEPVDRHIAVFRGF